jgi:hypothetical protein
MSWSLSLERPASHRLAAAYAAAADALGMNEPAAALAKLR